MLISVHFPAVTADGYMGELARVFGEGCLYDYRIARLERMVLPGICVQSLVVFSTHDSFMKMKKPCACTGTLCH